MASSLKTNYLLLTLAAIALLSGLVGSLAYMEHRREAQSVGTLASQIFATKLEAQLEDRAGALARLTAA
ncbi:MAG: hypothetical protein KGL34_05310, partial [Gammaproteobacteria bacterium]|nr:hypothetical protein [Gammaproteobacteria bacterium]